MKIENTEVFNFRGALRGMRNPKNSWDKSDSFMHSNGKFILGDNDKKLAQTLIKAGSEHRKFLRQIFVCVDFTMPLYQWKEMDQYKVSTVTDSCSTMHKIASAPITKECFEMDDYNDAAFDGLDCDPVQAIIDTCEFLRQMYLETNDVIYWKELIRWLPESWLQKRTWTGNYEILRSIYNQRKNHKLTEWHTVCNWIETLPYAKELILI